MEDNTKLSVAIDILDRKIANLTIKVSENPNTELKDELEKNLKLRDEIYKGNVSLISKVINDVNN